LIKTLRLQVFVIEPPQTQSHSICLIITNKYLEWTLLLPISVYGLNAQ